MTLRRPRIIPRLAVKGDSVVVTVNLEGLRKVGKPADLARYYADQDVDELLYLDVVASLYGRNQLESILEETCEEVFIPITVGGGISTIHDIRRILRHGADKVAINTAGIRRPNFISEAAETFGSQAITCHIDAKSVNGGWEAYTENGRQRTGKDAIEWAHEAVRLGAGELLITSIDQEGTKRGCDVELIKAIAPNVSVPVIACGGISKPEHIQAVSQYGACVAISSALHTNTFSINDIRERLNL